MITGHVAKHHIFARHTTPLHVFMWWMAQFPCFMIKMERDREGKRGGVYPCRQIICSMLPLTLLYLRVQPYVEPEVQWEVTELTLPVTTSILFHLYPFHNDSGTFLCSWGGWSWGRRDVHQHECHIISPKLLIRSVLVDVALAAPTLSGFLLENYWEPQQKWGEKIAQCLPGQS